MRILIDAPTRVELVTHRWEAFLTITLPDGESVEVVFSADEALRQRDRLYVGTRTQYDQDLADELGRVTVGDVPAGPAGPCPIVGECGKPCVTEAMCSGVVARSRGASL